MKSLHNWSEKLYLKWISNWPLILSVASALIAQGVLVILFHDKSDGGFNTSDAVLIGYYL